MSFYKSSFVHTNTGGGGGGSGYAPNKVIVSDSEGDLEGSGLNAAQLSTLSGVTSNIQTQLDSKLTGTGFTSNKVMVSDNTGILAAGTLDAAKIDYLIDVSSPIQAQLDSKVSGSGFTVDRVAITSGSGDITSSSVQKVELEYLSGVSSAIQPQINSKLSSSGHSSNIIVVTNASGDIAGSSVTTTELDTLDNIASNIQDQLNSKLTSPTLTSGQVLIANEVGDIDTSTISTTKLGYLTDVTSNIQAQIDSKLPSPTLSADRVLVSSGSGSLAASTVSTTKLGYLTDVTSNIQAQIDAKQDSISLTPSRATVSDGSGNLISSAVTTDEVNRLSGVTSGIQGQINNKQPLNSTLTSIALMDFSDVGVLVHSGISVEVREIVSGDSNIVVTNGDGSLGNISISLAPGAVPGTDPTFSTVFIGSGSNLSNYRCFTGGDMAITAGAAGSEITLRPDGGVDGALGGFNGLVKINKNEMTLNTSTGNGYIKFDNVSHRLGIGNMAPAQSLHVAGNVLVEAFGLAGAVRGIFFRPGFYNNNMEITAMSGRAIPSITNGLKICAYDGIKITAMNQDIALFHNDTSQNRGLVIGTNAIAGVSPPQDGLHTEGRVRIGASNTYGQLSLGADSEGHICFTASTTSPNTDPVNDHTKMYIKVSGGFQYLCFAYREAAGIFTKVMQLENSTTGTFTRVAGLF